MTNRLGLPQKLLHSGCNSSWNFCCLCTSSTGLRSVMELLFLSSPHPLNFLNHMVLWMHPFFNYERRPLMIAQSIQLDMFSTLSTLQFALCRRERFWDLIILATDFLKLWKVQDLRLTVQVYNIEEVLKVFANVCLIQLFFCCLHKYLKYSIECHCWILLLLLNYLDREYGTDF